MELCIRRKIILPLLVGIIISMIFNKVVPTTILILLMIDVQMALSETKHNKPLPYHLRIPFLKDFVIILPMLDNVYVLTGKSELNYKDLRRIVRYNFTSNYTGFLMWYVYYACEFLIHFIVLGIFFKQWYFETYQPDMEKFRVKFRTLLRTANNNVCFNEFKYLNKFEWFEYLTNKTMINVQ